jgi:hypothetical protein
MQTSASETMFPTLGPAYHQLCLVLARLWRPFGQLFVAVSLRRLMMFVLVLGAILGWYVRGVRIQRGAVAAIEATGGSVYYDSQNRNEGPNFYYKPFGLKWLFHPRDLSPKWLVDRIGFDYTGAVVSARLGPKADDDTMVQVEHLDRLENFSLIGTNVTDAGLAHLRGHLLLREVDLGQTKITDAGLTHLKGLKNLRVITLWNTRVTDEGVLTLEEALPWVQIFRDEDLAFSAGAARAIRDLRFARTQPIRLACLLLAHRADREGHRGEKAELIATADAICELWAGDKVSLLKVASACASCIRSLDLISSADLPAEEKKAIEDRLALHGIRALGRAVDLGLKTLPRSPIHSFWPLDRYPGFQELNALIVSPPHAPVH